MKMLNAKVLSLLLPGMLGLASMPAQALHVFPSIHFNGAAETCVLNALGAGDCVIPGFVTASALGLPAPLEAYMPQLLSVTTDTSLVTVLSAKCANQTFTTFPGTPATPDNAATPTFYSANDAACDIVIAVKPGAVIGGDLLGELTYSYSWIPSFQPDPLGSGWAIGPPNPSIVQIIDPPLDSYLTTILGDPSSQGSDELFGSNGEAVGNSSTADSTLRVPLGLTPTAGGASVPAPGVAGLFGLALLGFSFGRRRKV
jgi:hypothetical protein